MRRFGFLIIAGLLAVLVPASAGAALLMPPAGVYVVDNGPPAAAVLGSSAYQQDVAGDAIYVPIAKLVRPIKSWRRFNWSWHFLDALVRGAISRGKRFSIALEVGFQLPSGFEPACSQAAGGQDCAPIFDLWLAGNGGRCVSDYVPLPWLRQVQRFWRDLAIALRAHLIREQTYDSLTLIHVPGLSVGDEQLRLPSGEPSPPAISKRTCPDGRLPGDSVEQDVSSYRLRQIGYSERGVVNGFTAIARAFADAFPDRYVGVSIYPGVAFPHAANRIVARIVGALSALAPGRLELQGDDLTARTARPALTALARRFATTIGWQTSACDKCAFPSALQNGRRHGGTYFEVSPSDVVRFPCALSAFGLGACAGPTR